MAENLADLIDGYCRLISNETHSLIVRVQKGERPASLVQRLSVRQNYKQKKKEFVINLMAILPDNVCFCPLEGERALPSIPK